MNEIENEGIKSYGSVPLKTLKAAVAQIEKICAEKEKDINEISVTFEYLIGSFFPEIVKRVHDEANKQYTMGYFAGLKSQEQANDS